MLVPDPPLVVSGSAVANVPLTDVSASVAWVALAKVTDVGALDTALKFTSAASFAVTVHVPARVTVKEEPFTVQPVAVPLTTE